MVRNVAILSAAGLALGSCATSSDTPNNFAAERGIFGSPYVAPEIGERGVGPDGEPLFYPGAGRFAYDRDGNKVRLSRDERRTFRERARTIREQAEQDELVARFNARQDELPPQPEPGAPPVASTGNGDTPR